MLKIGNQGSVQEKGISSNDAALGTGTGSTAVRRSGESSFTLVVVRDRAAGMALQVYRVPGSARDVPEHVHAVLDYLDHECGYETDFLEDMVDLPNFDAVSADMLSCFEEPARGHGASDAHAPAAKTTNAQPCRPTSEV